MLHERKAANGMRDEFELRIDYGFGHGFELVTTEDTLSAIRVRCHEYHKNETFCASKIVQRRVPIVEG